MCRVEECYLVEIGYGYDLNGEHLFKRNDYIPYKTLNLFLNQRKMYSTFCTAYRYNTKNVEESELYGDLYFDFDDITDFEKVRVDAIKTLSFLHVVFGVNKEDLRIYYSGNKGVHIIVPAPILGVEPNKNLNGIYKLIAIAAKSFSTYKTVDTQIYDSKRLFRIPNTIHEKSKLYKIPLTVDELRNLSEAEIKGMAAQQRKIPQRQIVLQQGRAHEEYIHYINEYEKYERESKKKAGRQGKKTIDFVPPCIEKILNDGASEGSRNITIACLAGFYKNYGKSLDEAINLVSEWNDRNIRPTGINEMKKTVKSIYNSEKQYGCNTLKSISDCNPDICKIAQNRRSEDGRDKPTDNNHK